MLDGADSKAGNRIAYAPLDEQAPATLIGRGNTTSIGKVFEYDLKSIDINYIPPARCNELYQDAIFEGMLCFGDAAGGKAACQGDSGGPAVQKNAQNEYLLKGLTSFGLVCGQPQNPNVYTNVQFYDQWIQSNIASIKSFRESGTLSGEILNHFCYTSSTLTQTLLDRSEMSLTYKTELTFVDRLDVPPVSTPGWKRICHLNFPAYPKLTIEHAGDYAKVIDQSNPEAVSYFQLKKSRSIDATCTTREDASILKLQTEANGAGWIFIDNDWSYMVPIDQSMSDQYFQASQNLKTCELISSEGPVQVQTTLIPDQKAGIVKLVSEFATFSYAFSHWKPEKTLHVEVRYDADARPTLNVINNGEDTLYNWNLECTDEFLLNKNGEAIAFSDEFSESENESGGITKPKFRKFRFLWPGNPYSVIPPQGTVTFEYDGPQLEGTHLGLCTINGLSIPLHYIKSAKE